jgi:phage terminase large subunit-like protein
MAVTLSSPAATSLVEFAAYCGLDLEPFQRRISKAIAGPEREFVCLLPRGQGKTHLLAIVALHYLVTVEGAKVYCCAASVQQAKVLFEAAARYARASGIDNIVHRHLELRWCPDPAREREFTRHLRVLPAQDAGRLHGLTFDLCILDELQAFRTDEVYVALSSALHKQPNSKLVVISTAGQGADSPLGKLRAIALASPEVKRRGVVTDCRGGGVRMLEWALDDDADIDDPRTVKRVNPASWITPAQLAEQRRRLPDLAYRRFICNQWTERAGHWLPPGAWQACVGTPTFQPGEKLWVGADIGGERSASAVAWINERLQVGVGIYYGERGVLEVLDHVRELAAAYQVVEVVYDPWRFGQAAQELEQAGMRVTAFPQTDQRMIPASSRLHAAIVEKRITLPDDPELRAHAANTIARHSRRGWRIDKPSKSTHIDAIVALCMALDAHDNQPLPGKFWGWV